MHCIIVDAHGAILESRLLADDEVIDAEVEAERYADSRNREVQFTPYRCQEGDFVVQFRQDPENAMHLWDSQGFYFTDEE